MQSVLAKKGIIFEYIAFFLPRKAHRIQPKTITQEQRYVLWANGIVIVKYLCLNINLQRSEISPNSKHFARVVRKKNNLLEGINLAQIQDPGWKVVCFDQVLLETR